MTKSIKVVAVAALVAIAVVVYFRYSRTSRKNHALVQRVDPAFGQYVEAYTGGIVGAGDPIRIRLVAAVADASAGKEADDLISLSPSVSGKTVWADNRTIEFTPSKRLESGKDYTVSFSLDEVMPVQGDFKTFTFDVRVISQQEELTIEHVRPISANNPSLWQIDGKILTTDVAVVGDVQKTITAKQDGAELPVSVVQGDGKSYSFSIKNVKRKAEKSSVIITINGEPLGAETKEDKEIPLPPLGEFSVTDVRVVNGLTQYILVRFSDLLQENQAIEGLLSIANVGSLDYEIKDNEIKILPSTRQTGSYTLQVAQGIRNWQNKKLTDDHSFPITFDPLSPALRWASKGNILPDEHGFILPFEAVNLKSVTAKVIKIYENNVLQFLQDGSLSQEYYQLNHVGKVIVKKTINLENSGVTDIGKWNRFNLDLTSLVKTEQGAFYKVMLSFKKNQAVYGCANQDEGEDNMDVLEQEETDGNESSYWDAYENEYSYDEEYDWRQRDNPCNAAYYTSERNINRQILASDMGLLAKSGADGSLKIFVTNLKTAKAWSGAEVEIFDYQKQSLMKGKTDGDGAVSFAQSTDSWFAVARADKQRAYLKLDKGESLSVSQFDVQGETVSKGLKGFLYGDRGVWRPGDSLFVSCIVEDKQKQIPAHLPAVFELTNPKQQVVTRMVLPHAESGFYTFRTATDANAPTGQWEARVKIGAANFMLPLKIETVKPNRLKINLDFGVEKITAQQGNLNGKLEVKWLQGMPAKNVKATFDLTLTKAETKFDRYADYTFDDPTLEANSETVEMFNGTTDENGLANFSIAIPEKVQAPGVMNAVIRGKVFEESGDFSIDRFSIPYYPFTSFTGIRLPKGDKARNMLLTDTTHRVDIATIDANGKPTSRKVEVKLYKLSWRWWWDASSGNANFLTGNSETLIAQSSVTTTNGKGSWNFKIKYPEWGRFFVHVTDAESGSSCGKVVYIDWPGWAGRSRNNEQGATMLSFSSDKTNYTVGEKATIVIPGCENGRALISFENGSRVLRTEWVDMTKEDVKYSFKITEDMAPTVYANISLIQPHAQTKNDLPMRLYGVIPIAVENPNTHLEPIISMPNELEPGQEVQIKISEKNNRAMTYTVAVVEEGLLDLTRYKTPDPWHKFYAREALGVTTWDMFDAVMGASIGKIERLLALGGGEDLISKDGSKNKNRFQPVVKFFGPFTLNGKSATHKFTMPNYVGSVKTMVVAADEGAYGSAEKATPVRKPLMVLATLPRALSPKEVIQFPITLFSTDASIKNVSVRVSVSNQLSLSNGSTREVTMSGMGDKTISFPITVKESTGKAKIDVTAVSGKFTATTTTWMDIQNTNPPITTLYQKDLAAGKNWEAAIALPGVAGTNKATLELSVIPPINLEARMQYLIQYPHGCIEQTTSAVFPQLYVGNLKSLTKEEQATIQKNVNAAIERLKLFVSPDGGFGYWPGSENADSWGTSYAGHFLIEAAAQGYYVPHVLLKQWKKYQRNRATAWDASKEGSQEFLQAYRLYTLALANSAEIGAMNRMREMKVSTMSFWLLAAAYAKAGQLDAAQALIARVPTKPNTTYNGMDYSYGSDLRDQALIIETLLLLNQRGKAVEPFKQLCTNLGDARVWMSTQTTAWCLKAVSQFAKTEKSDHIKLTYQWNGKTVEVETQLPMAQVVLPMDKKSTLKITNTSKGTIFARVIASGIPAESPTSDESSDLDLRVTYSDSEGNALDPTTLVQGTEFVANYTVSNPGTRGVYRNLSLTAVAANGWEVTNLRLTNDEILAKYDAADYEDIRDNTLYYYFGLAPREQKTFRVMLTATYAGTYQLPSVKVEAMYNGSIFALSKGMNVTVGKPITP